MTAGGARETRLDARPGDRGEGRAIPEAAWTTVILLTLLYLVSYVDRFALVVLITPLKADLGLSDTQIGLLVGTSFAVFYTLFALPISRLADRANRRNLIFWGAVGWNLLTALSSFANSFEALLVLRVGVALGEAVLLPAALSMIADLFSRDRRGLPISVFLGVGAAGSAGALLIAAGALDLMSQPLVRQLPLVEALAPWRATLLFLGFSGMLLAVAFRLIAVEPSRPPRSAQREASVAEVARHFRSHWLTYLGFIGATSLAAMTTISILSWYPSNLVRAYGLAPESAGYLFGLIGISATLAGGLLMPNLAARFYARGRDDAAILVAIAASLLAAPILLSALLAPTATFSLGLAAPGFFVAIGMAIMMTGTLALLPPAHLRGQVTAVFMLFTNLAGLGSGPLLVAWFADNWFAGPDGLRHGLGTLILICLPLQLLLLIISRRSFARSVRASAEVDNA